MTALIEATPSHAAALAAIHAAAFPPGERWSADVMTLQLGLRGVFGWLHPDGGMILARSVVEEAEVLTLAVAQSARRRGIGRHLVAATLAHAAFRGAASVVLEVSVENGAALGLYAGLGFIQVGRRAQYYAGTDALILRAPSAPAHPPSHPHDP